MPLVTGAASRRVGRAVLDALPPAARRRVQGWRGRPVPTVIGLGELDDRLEQARQLFATSEDAARTYLDSFELAPPAERPDDPFSSAYGDWVWDLYRRISGRPTYSAENERSPFDLDDARRRPYPYATGSPSVVAHDLVARGFVIGCLDLHPPGRIVEFGPGWGNLTVDLATLGFEVTGVEVEPDFCQLVESRCPVPERLSMVQSDMLAFQPDRPFDAAVFYESFHHCADHLAMLERLQSIVVPGGVVLFAAEPVGELAYPWGPRLDGLSLWSTRIHGWLELGFAAGYFAEALARTGWRAEHRRATAVSPLADVYITRSQRQPVARQR